MKDILESDRDFFKGIFAIEAIIFVLLLNFGVIAYPGINMESIARIESNKNPKAISKAGAIGTYQIMPIVLKSFNQRHKQDYKKKDLFNESINKKIATWYLKIRIPEMLKYYNLEVNVENILWSYNAGISNCKNRIMPKETENYIKKYRRLNNGKI